MTDPSDSGTTQLAPPPPPPPPPPATGQSAPPPLPHGRPPRSGSGVFVGVALILFGAMFLAAQVVPGIAWWSLWPLIIVVAGAVQMVTPAHDEGWSVYRLFEGLGTVVFGLVLLGNTTGYIAWSAWWTFITLWPVLLIALGVGIIGKGTGADWLRIVASLMVTLTLAFAAATSTTGAVGIQPVGVWVRTSGQAFHDSEPVSGAVKAELSLKGGAADITVREGAELVAIDGTTPFGAPDFRVSRSGDRASATVNLGDSHGPVIIAPGITGARLNMTLSQKPVWTILFETGASTLDADLSHLQVEDVELKTGASSSVIRLGEVPSDVRRATCLVKSGVASVKILVPASAEARVETANGLSGTDVGSRFAKRDGAYQTSGYSSASRAWDIRVESGVSAITVTTY